VKTIGVIEIKDNTLEIAVFKKTSDNFVLDSTHTIQKGHLSPIEGVRHYVLVLPDDKVHLRFLELPFSEESRLREVVPYELREMITYQPDEIVFSAIPLGADGKVLVGYVERTYLERLLDELQGRGFNIQRITSVELYRTLKELEATPVDSLSREELFKEELQEARVDFLKSTIGYERRLSDVKALLNGVLRLAIVWLFASAVLLTFKWYPLKVEISRLNEKKTALFKQLFPQEKAVAPLYQLKAQIKNLQQELEELEHIQPWKDFALLSINWPLSLKADSVEIRQESILVKGYAEGLAEIEHLKNILAKRFSQVNILQSEKTGQLMRYTIEVKR